MNFDRKSFAALAVLPVALLTACGGGGGGGGSDGADATGAGSTPTVDVNGTWNVTEQVSSGCAGEGNFTDSYQVAITQHGSDITVDTPLGKFSGTADGRTLSWSGSYAQNGGTTTIDALDLTANEQGTSFSGDSKWHWTDGRETCSGTTHTTGTRA